jgi:CBS domain-containing protein
MKSGNSKIKEPENYDREIQRDLDRSEGEGYAVMYQSEKTNHARKARQKTTQKSSVRKVKDIMTPDPACCLPTTNLQEVAHTMVQFDCGEIPVVDNKDDYHPIGVVTDRDIICRLVAEGINPMEKTAQDCMTQPCIFVTPEATIEACCQLLEENQIRRILVIDKSGRCCGIVAQADLATRIKEKAGEVLKEVSRPKKRF